MFYLVPYSTEDFGPVFENPEELQPAGHNRQQRIVQEDSVMSAISSVHDVFSQSSVAGEREGRTAQAPLRLTRRGWMVLVVLPLMMVAVFLLILTGAFTSPAQAADNASDLSVTPTVSVIVQSGESLWGIAAAVAPERDPRDVVADIVQLNNLSAGTVKPGQQLFVPTK